MLRLSTLGIVLRAGIQRRSTSCCHNVLQGDVCSSVFDFHLVRECLGSSGCQGRNIPGQRVSRQGCLRWQVD